MSTPALGIIVAVLFDFVLPLALAGPLILHNRRHGRSPGGERRFWIGAGIYLALVAFAVWRGVVDVIAYQGLGVVGATIVALPSSIVPAVFNSYAIHHFFTFQEWTHFGYLSVLIVYVAGMIAWGLLNAVGLRALVAAGSGVYERREAAARRTEVKWHQPDGVEQLGLASPSLGGRDDKHPSDSVER